MRSLGAHICDRQEEPGGQLAFYVQVPLLDVPTRMVAGIHLGDGLHDLSQILLRSLNSQTASGWQRDSRRERKSDGAHGMRSVHGAEISCGAGVDHIVQGIESKRDVVWNPEDSVATAYHRFRIDAVG